MTSALSLAAGVPGGRPGKNGRSRAVDFRPLVLGTYIDPSHEKPSAVSTANMAGTSAVVTSSPASTPIIHECPGRSVTR